MVLLGQGSAQADANTLFATEADRPHGTGETALELAEGIVGSLQTIDADPDIVEIRRADLCDVLLCDQRAIGGQRDKETLGAGVGAEFKQIVTQQRFTAGK